MPYKQLIEPGVPSSGRVSFHVPAGTPEREVAAASYAVLKEHDPLDLVVGDWFAGVMTMATVLPLLLTMDNAVRGHAVRSRAGSAGRGTRVAPAQVTRCRCPVCGAIAYVLGPGLAGCRVAGHGPMVPLSAE